MKIFLDVIGCRLNQSEAEGIGNAFRALGHEIVSAPGHADLAIVNTCAVTVKAAADSRKKLRRAAREGARRVVATGCWATLYPQRALNLPGVSDVFLNADKDRMVSALTGVPQEHIDLLPKIRQPLPGDRARTRAFIKVQEGCDNHCTYCLTRLARGRSQSRPLAKILGDIAVAVAGGAREVVLTGVQLGAWGKDLTEQRGLADLLEKCLAYDELGRLRLSSIEPWELTSSLLIYWQDQRLCRHLHIPLQSGDDRILKAMGRPIRSEDYRRLIEQIRTVIPGVAITTDVIAGFPGESTESFNTTVNFISSIGFAGGHVFTYSPRPGTAAFKMEPKVLVSEAKARNASLRQVLRKAGRDFRTGFIGQQMTVLWESADKVSDGVWQVSGLTDNYLRVIALAGEDMRNTFSRVILEKDIPEEQALAGSILPE